MNVEKPLFFLHGKEFFPPFASSEYLLGVVKPVSDRGGLLSVERSPPMKPADCLDPALSILGSGDVCDKGGGPGRRKEF